MGWAVVPGVRPWGEQEWLGDQLGTHRVDDKADGLQLGSLGPCPPPVLLHQGHQAGADGFVVLWGIIFLGERDLKLWVGPECVCGGSRSGWPCPSQGGQASHPSARLLNGAQECGESVAHPLLPAPLSPLAHQCSSGSPLQCCPSSSCPRRRWCANTSCSPHKACRVSSCRFPGG